MRMPLLDLLETLEQASDAGNIIDTAESYFGNLQFGVTNFAVGERDGSAITGVYTNMSQEWMEHYVSSGYVDCDPVADHILNGKESSFYLSDDLDYSLRQENALETDLCEEAKEVGIRSAVVVPFQSFGNMPAIASNIASSLPSVEFRTFFEEKREEILVGIALVNIHLSRKIMDEAGDNPDDPSYYQIAERGRLLSIREVEALKWLSEGYRNDRIAEKMNISPVTVNFHFQSAKKKLGAKTREHMIALAISKHLISF